MKRVLVIFAVSAFVLVWPFAATRADEASNAHPPLSQALVREGDFAVVLAHNLKLDASGDEARAESSLVAAGIEPKGGWISDYPVTPVVLGQLQESVTAAADAGRLSMAGNDAVNALSDAAAAAGLPVRTGNDSYAGTTSSGLNYEDDEAIAQYYDDTGPPVVSYYSPPWDYEYLYDYVPYPFWYDAYYFPGFYILRDFDVIAHDHHHRFDRDDHFHHVTNHKFDRDGRSFVADATNPGHLKLDRSPNSFSLNRFGRSDAQALNGARSIWNRDSARSAPALREAGSGSSSRAGTVSGFRGNHGSPGMANRNFHGNTGGIGVSGGVRMRSEYRGYNGSVGVGSYGGGMGHSFRSNGGGGGLSHGGFGGGLGHAGGFSHGSGAGGGFASHGGGFSGGHGGGFGGGHGGGSHR